MKSEIFNFVGYIQLPYESKQCLHICEYYKKRFSWSNGSLFTYWWGFKITDNIVLIMEVSNQKLDYWHLPFYFSILGGSKTVRLVDVELYSLHGYWDLDILVLKCCIVDIIVVTVHPIIFTRVNILCLRIMFLNRKHSHLSPHIQKFFLNVVGVGLHIFPGLLEHHLLVVQLLIVI